MSGPEQRSGTRPCSGRWQGPLSWPSAHALCGGRLVLKVKTYFGGARICACAWSSTRVAVFTLTQRENLNAFKAEIIKLYNVKINVLIIKKLKII